MLVAEENSHICLEGDNCSATDNYFSLQSIYTQCLEGENSPLWKGGLSFDPYCPKFNESLKEIIRERDNRTCQLCNTKENGKKLCVHHIHYDKENCAPDLISLCTRCSTKVNFNRDYYETLFIGKLKSRGLLC